ncbi:MAG: hypothetical protein WCK98_01065 [bacterium]
MFNTNNFNNAKENQQSSSAKNPFTQEEGLQAWLENDTDYQKAKLKVKNTLRLNKTYTFMSSNNPYINFVNYITKHAILATLIMFLAVGSLSASALETFGPNQYKPSTISKNLFNSNKQPDKDPYTALKADSNNEVASLDACDISVKFAKQINGKNVEVYNEKRYQGNDQINYFTLSDSYEYTREFTNQIIKGEKPNVAFSSFNLSCDKIDVFSEFIGYNVTKLTVQELREKTGWLITEASLGDIYKAEGGKADPSNYIYFKYNGTRYNISYLNKEYTDTFNPVKILPQIQPEQVQIQFNSIVKNQSTKPVLDKPETQKPEANKPQETPKTNPIKIELKNSAGLVKSVNLPIIEDGNSAICGIQYVTNYMVKPKSDNAGSTNNNVTGAGAAPGVGPKLDDQIDMYISNSNLGFNLEQKQSYQKVLDLISKKIKYSNNNEARVSGNSFLNPFISGCSGFGFSYEFLPANQVIYANTDSSITLYTLEGNGETGNPTVRIYAKKGDNIFTLSTTLFSYDMEAIIKKCTIVKPVGEGIDNICYEDALKADSKLKTALDKAASELVKTFAIK